MISARLQLTRMPPTWVWFVLNLLICVTASSDGEVDSDTAYVELTEFDYEDNCFEAADAEWTYINSPTNESLLSIWEKKQIEYGNHKKLQRGDIVNRLKDGSADPSVEYKYDVIVRAGDALVDAETWKQLVHFAGEAELLRGSATYARKAEKLSRKDVDRVLSHSGRIEDKLDAWTGWYQELNPLLVNFTRNLPLLLEAAKANDVSSVTEYWEVLSGFPSGYSKMEDQWLRVTDLHKLIVKLAQLHLSHKYDVKVNETIPAHLLGSLQGNDWTTMSIDMAPYTNFTSIVRKNLWKKKFIGKQLYKSASGMGSIMFGKVPEAEFWDKSHFYQQCPSKLINFCKEGKMRISTCFEATMSNFLSAHKNVAKILVNQMSVESIPILNIANRYSSLEEGMSELFGILSASPAWLNRVHLLKSSENNEECGILSLMFTALDVLPRLAYYMAADMWRLNAIEKNITNPEELVASWWKYREQYEGISSERNDVPTFLVDSYITSNKPYLPKIAGILLSFQIYEYLMESTEVRYDSIYDKPINVNLIKMIQQGAADNWMQITDQYLEIDDILAEPLVSFFTPLEEFLDIMEDTFEYKPDVEEEKSLEELEKAIIYEINNPTTTPPPTTTSTIMTTLKPLDRIQDKKANTSEADKGLQSDSAHVQADKPEDSSKAQVNESVKVPQETPYKLDDFEYEDDNRKPKIDTSKAVWAVAAVLVATVIICIIAIFGRQRCRKTPKNRRYV